MLVHSWLIIMDPSSWKGQVLPLLYESNLSNIMGEKHFSNKTEWSVKPYLNEKFLQMINVCVLTTNISTANKFEKI